MNKNASNTMDSGFLESSLSENDQTLVLGKSRKRKASFVETSTHDLSDVLDCYSPQFSSTINESLKRNLEKIHLENETSTDHISSPKVSRISEHQKFYSLPNTPEHQIKYSREPITKKASTNSFIKNFSQFGLESHSPLNKEAYEILYPELPSQDNIKKITTPFKVDKEYSHIKKSLFYVPNRNLLNKIVSNSIIMNKILKYLSNGDLFRLAQVSVRFKDAILLDKEASDRLHEVSVLNKQFKENYKITPPSSPEKEENLDIEGSNFKYFLNFAKDLNKDQYIIKCPQCEKASIVQHDIAQCQGIKCGYIFCRKCGSFATNPKDFKDQCNNAKLLNSAKNRYTFGDLSNSTITSDYMTDNSSSFFSSSFSLNFSSKLDLSSGIFSNCEVSTPKPNVKRNLMKTFKVPSDQKQFPSDRNANDIIRKSSKLNRRVSIIPVVPIESTKTSLQKVIEPSSPPRVKPYSVGSKQSKRNLKRLTR